MAHSLLRQILIRRLWRTHSDLLLKLHGLSNNIVRENRQFIDLFVSVREQRKALLSFREAYNIYSLVQKSCNIEGDIAEVGVYKGGSARVICEVKGQKTLHLFDTFEGMPETNATFDRHRKGDFSDTSLMAVRAYLAAFDNVEYYAGVFPHSAKHVADQALSFCLVNLDVDLYESTLAGLSFFYPRLSKNGFLLSHDYSSRSCPGVKRAFSEFFADKPEPIIEVWDSQALVIKQ